MNNTPPLVNPTNGRAYRGGAVARKNALDNWDVYQPGDAMFSTALFVATHVLRGNVWTPVDEERGTVDTTDHDLTLGTQALIDQLQRYGGRVATGEVLRALQAVEQINDDLWHDRHPGTINQHVTEAIRVLRAIHTLYGEAGYVDPLQSDVKMRKVFSPYEVIKVTDFAEFSKAMLTRLTKSLGLTPAPLEDDLAHGSDHLPEWAKAKSNGEWDIGAQLCTKDGRRTGNACIVDRGARGWMVLTDAGSAMVMQDAELDEVFYRPQWIMDPLTCPGQREADKAHEPDDDDLLNMTTDDLLQGFGASEDHETLISALRIAGFTPKMVERVHRSIVCAEKFKGEPVLYVAPNQLERHTDYDDTAAGRYIPARKTPLGKFTMALYATPRTQPLAAKQPTPFNVETIISALQEAPRPDVYCDTIEVATERVRAIITAKLQEGLVDVMSNTGFMAAATPALHAATRVTPLSEPPIIAMQTPGVIERKAEK